MHFATQCLLIWIASAVSTCWSLDGYTGAPLDAHHLGILLTHVSICLTHVPSIQLHISEHGLLFVLKFNYYWLLKLWNGIMFHCAGWAKLVCTWGSWLAQYGKVETIWPCTLSAQSKIIVFNLERIIHHFKIFSGTATARIGIKMQCIFLLEKQYTDCAGLLVYKTNTALVIRYTWLLC